ncbi:MAG: hypothetical protein E4H40_04470 [Candidatus Brocadiia bacterium]|nr:MAG: hypothetical protein E4H40_04470 [Candidatus Brocadiia bacterium]
MFYNWPLTIRGRILRRVEHRAEQKPRYWHVCLATLIGAAVLAITESIYLNKYGVLPGLRDLWWLVLGVSFLCGAAVTLWAGGAALWKRFVSGTICGAGFGLFYTIFTVILCMSGSAASDHLVSAGIWRVFIFSILTTIGAIVTEIALPERQIR